jgi:hypothetical protein
MKTNSVPHLSSVTCHEIVATAIDAGSISLLHAGREARRLLTPFEISLYANNYLPKLHQH